jgi:hypothetical protein
VRQLADQRAVLVFLPALAVEDMPADMRDADGDVAGGAGMLLGQIAEAAAQAAAIADVGFRLGGAGGEQKLLGRRLVAFRRRQVVVRKIRLKVVVIPLHGSGRPVRHFGGIKRTLLPLILHPDDPLGRGAVVPVAPIRLIAGLESELATDLRQGPLVPCRFGGDLIVPVHAAESREGSPVVVTLDGPIAAVIVAKIPAFRCSATERA